MNKKMLNIGLRLTKNIIKHLMGRSAMFPHLGSNTMEKEDAGIVKYWLKRRELWNKEEIPKEFGHGFANRNGSTYGYAFMGARVALSACISALELGPGDEVIVPGYTCVVVPNAFRFAGVTVVYADIELDTYGLSVESMAQKITPKTKAVLLHHLYGLVCRDYGAVIKLAREHKLVVIEDCAQATGAEYKGKKVGSRGDVAIYSSEQSKAFTTGQGGIATTSDKTIANKMQRFYDRAPFPTEERVTQLLHTLLYNYYAYAHPRRWFWKDWAEYKYGDQYLVSTTQEEMEGKQPEHYGCKMPAPLAILGIYQMSKLHLYNEQRRANAEKWDRWCDSNGYKKPMVVKGSLPVFLRYPVIVEPEKKSDLNWAIDQLKVRPGLWFQSNLHPAASTLEGCPNADKAVAGCINFPTL
ncbi:MAG: hypothetical protein GY940_14190 [bacterium]|nr:hypothetical protein [bacterium]